MSNWSIQKEREYQSASEAARTLEIERIKEFEKLRDLLNAAFSRVTFGIDDIECLIRNADSLRDALAPFDSGVRVNAGAKE